MPGRARVSLIPQFKGEENKGRINIELVDVQNPSYDFSPADQERIEAAREEGILIPEVVMAVSRWAGIAFATGCTLVHKESYKGQNWWGSDPTWMRGLDLKSITIQGGKTLREVTEIGYKIYRAHVDLDGTEFQAQGCGPGQLTSYGFQSRADWFGGCWKPEKNLMASFGWWREQRDTGKSTQEVASMYNGSETYGEEFMELLGFWQGVIR